MTDIDPRVDALAERLYGQGFGPLDARRNVARRYLEAADAVDPLRAVTGDRFDRDSEALAWARGRVEYHRDRYARFERESLAKGNVDNAVSWARMKNMLDRDLIGGTGCTIAAFDERRPAILAATDKPTAR